MKPALLSMLTSCLLLSAMARTVAADITDPTAMQVSERKLLRESGPASSPRLVAYANTDDASGEQP